MGECNTKILTSVRMPTGTKLLLGIFMVMTLFAGARLLVHPTWKQLLYTLLPNASFTVVLWRSCRPGASELRLSPDRFTVKGFLGWCSYDWKDVDDFRATEIADALFKFDYEWIEFARRRRNGRVVRTRLSDIYDPSGEALARLLTEWRARCLAARRSP